MGVTAASGYSKAVDLYNGASGTWSTAQLSVARRYLAAASVGNVAMFAGGVRRKFVLLKGGLFFLVEACGCLSAVFALHSSLPSRVLLL